MHLLIFFSFLMLFFGVEQVWMNAVCWFKILWKSCLMTPTWITIGDSRRDNIKSKVQIFLSSSEGGRSVRLHSHSRIPKLPSGDERSWKEFCLPSVCCCSVQFAFSTEQNTNRCSLIKSNRSDGGTEYICANVLSACFQPPLPSHPPLPPSARMSETGTNSATPPKITYCRADFLFLLCDK